MAGETAAAKWRHRDLMAKRRHEQRSRQHNISIAPSNARRIISALLSRVTARHIFSLYIVYQRRKRARSENQYRVAS